MKNFARKLNSDWTKLGLYLILGPQEVTLLIGSTTDMNPTSTQCDRRQASAVPQVIEDGAKYSLVITDSCVVGRRRQNPAKHMQASRHMLRNLMR